MHFTNFVSALAAGYLHSISVKNDGTVWACGYGGYGQLGYGSINDAIVPIQMNTCTSLTSASEISSSNNFGLIFPNPTSGNFRIKTGIVVNSQLEIFNLLGEKIYSAILNEPEKEIELKNAAAGIYFVRVSEWERVYTQKLVIE